MPGGFGQFGWWRLLAWAVIFIAPTAFAAPPTSATSNPGGRVVRRRVAALPVKPQSVVQPPGPAALAVQIRRIQEIYVSDYSDISFNARRALAQRMIVASDQTGRDTNARFALLREARDISAGVGDVTTAFDAVHRQAIAFPVSELTERIEVLKMAAPVLNTNQSRLAAVSICMDLIDQCIAEGDYDRAHLLLGLASDLVRQAKSLPHLTWVDARAASLRPIVEAYETVRPAELRLLGLPDDPAANLVMGKFVAFTRGDLDAGLNMLCKGSDAEFAKVADQDLVTSDDPADALKTANAWWEMSQNQPELRDAMRRRASFWYQRGIGVLEGLDRVMIERRITESNPPTKPGAKRLVPPDALKLSASPPRWYRASIAEVTWDAAAQICRESGGQLVCVETRVESEMMSKLAKSRTLWLGASIDGRGKWSWLNGGNFLFTNWSSAEPSILTPDAHPVISPNGAWRTLTGKAGFICEWNE